MHIHVLERVYSYSCDIFPSSCQRDLYFSAFHLCALLRGAMAIASNAACIFSLYHKLSTWYLLTYGQVFHGYFNTFSLKPKNPAASSLPLWSFTATTSQFLKSFYSRCTPFSQEAEGGSSQNLLSSDVSPKTFCSSIPPPGRIWSQYWLKRRHQSLIEATTIREYIQSNFHGNAKYLQRRRS